MQRVGLHLTDRCQLDCDHCLRDPGARPGDLALETIAAVLADASSVYGIRRVSLTGGEPTLHPQFAGVLDSIVAHGMCWDMVSNGRRFDRVAAWFEEAPARRTSCRSITLSIDGATDATHDSIRGPGQRREVLAAISVAVAFGVPFSLTTTLHARNVDEIEAIAREAEALGASSVRFGIMQPTGTALDDELRLEPNDWRAALVRVEAMREQLSIPVLTTGGWPAAQSSTLCGALRGDTLHVDLLGRLTMCCLHAGLPHEAGPDRTVAGDASGGLRAPYAALIEIREHAISARSDQASEAANDPWVAFECNSCLKRYGRPHWSGDSVGGAAAVRSRWRGAWHRSGKVKRLLPVAR